ncbi:hypothetical protein BD324DRAFT_584132 [Kockovaella imperatae]|uniref:Uncharacterized protein n=1 Tax=Kockovaella imperatae TaxID=4999 RepID=A0A1Y1U7E4_9TREE|nr:hypothetical protein BD324DRAFT_584132 [Kockovaella imperatae]ORX33932.1 hypothetical protein BD324DRAFT_584132 [Kockovaella imperatae]
MGTWSHYNHLEPQAVDSSSSVVHVKIPSLLELNSESYVATGVSRRSPQSSRPKYQAHPISGLVCRPFGVCEPCPADELDQPFCLPFGNRRLLHCVPASEAQNGGEGDDGRQTSSEIPAWEACGKVIAQERRAFLEFVCANLLLLMVALGILWARTSVLAKAQYRQLAARIGFPGSSWRS